ncbi:unnamed protein product [Prunus armeniaca]
MYRDGELSVVLLCRSVSLWARPAFVFVPVAKPVTSLACPLGWLIFLLSRLFQGDLIVIPERVAFCGRDSVIAPYNVGFFYFESLDVISKGFIGLLAQVVQAVRALLDHSVKSIFLGEDESQLLEAADRLGW